MKDRGFVKASQNSMAEFAANQIKDMIISGRLKPGERLQEQDLCAAIGISRTPLREAFRILQTQNLLEYVPYHGVVVVELTYKKCMDQIRVRYILEQFAASCINAPLSAENKARLQEFRKIFLSIIAEEQEEQRLQRFFEWDQIFHIFISSLADNGEIDRLLPLMWNRETLFRIRFKMVFDVVSSCRDHINICNAFLADDIETGRTLVALHCEKVSVYEIHLRRELREK